MGSLPFSQEFSKDFMFPVSGYGGTQPVRRKPGLVRASWALFWLMLAAVMLQGCGEIGYYWQAGVGQLEIIGKRRPIEEVMADETVAPEVKAKLSLVLGAQAYGEQSLALPEGARFKYYADLERDYVSWLVVASLPFAIKEYENCFLIVGCLGYRGFFDKSDAEAFARELAADEYDVLVRPVRAYSTLGWFDDPVLSTYIRYGDSRLIGTVIHEQAHRVLFVEDDTAFNESFATFVEEEGLRLYLAARGEGGGGLLEEYLSRKEDQELFRRIVLAGRERLERMYLLERPVEEKRAEKARLFELMREDYRNRKNSFKIINYDGWFKQELNNAHLVGIHQYHSRVAAFRALFEREERDFIRFYAAAKELAGLPPQSREARMKTLEGNNLARHDLAE